MLLFIGADYYPAGPAEDFVCNVESEEEARERIKHCYGDWWELLGEDGTLLAAGRLSDA